MSKRSLIVIIFIVAAVAFAVGRYALLQAPGPSADGTRPQQDEAAKAASRAMTFTQPKAPAQ